MDLTLLSLSIKVLEFEFDFPSAAVCCVFHQSNLPQCVVVLVKLRAVPLGRRLDGETLNRQAARSRDAFDLVTLCDLRLHEYL